MKSAIFGRLRRWTGEATIGAMLAAAVIWAPSARALSFNLPPPGDDLVGHVQMVTARQQDTLLDIARRYDVGYDEIQLANPGVDMWLPGAGTRVVIPTRYILPKPWEGIVVNVAEMRLFYFPKPKPGETGKVITFPVSIGRGNWQTPLATTRVLAKIKNPSWTPPASIRKEHEQMGEPSLPPVVPGGPGNPLGLFALQLGLPGYLIHGTNKPFGVGMRVSHGCIRLYPENIETLFKEVPVDTPVRIINRPEQVGWDRERVYVEAYPDRAKDVTLARRLQSVRDMVRKEAARVPGRDIYNVDWTDVHDELAHPRGLPVDVTVGTREASVDTPRP
ncbi:MAG: L,D-transpeptidase family protein [Gammaproteobacteria bacterium]